jgi:hypothetical protein
MDVTTDIGLERIQRAVAMLMLKSVNDEIDIQNSLWEPRDTEWFSVTGRPNPGFTVEHIAPDNVYSGTIPSLITSPPSSYPNLCVIAYVGSPIGTQSDWTETYSITLALEFMVKSLTDEEMVNARIQRTLEAGHSVLTSDENRRIPDFDGNSLVPQISSKPTVTISDVFVRHTSSDPNDRSFYQHGSLTYRVDKFSSYS